MLDGVGLEERVRELGRGDLKADFGKLRSVIFAEVVNEIILEA